MQSYVPLGGRNIFNWVYLAYVLLNLSWLFSWIFPKIQEDHRVSLGPNTQLCIQVAGVTCKEAWPRRLPGNLNPGIRIRLKDHSHLCVTFEPFMPWYYCKFLFTCLSSFLDYELLEGRIVFRVHFVYCVANTWETFSRWLHKKERTREVHHWQHQALERMGRNENSHLLLVGLTELPGRAIWLYPKRFKCLSPKIKNSMF